MNGKISYWSVRVAGGWGVKRQGNRETLSVHELQRDAWREARRLTGGKQEGPRFAALDRQIPVRHAGGHGRAIGSVAGSTRSVVAGRPRRGPIAA